MDDGALRKIIMDIARKKFRTACIAAAFFVPSLTLGILFFPDQGLFLLIAGVSFILMVVRFIGALPLINIRYCRSVGKLPKGITLEDVERQYIQTPPENRWKIGGAIFCFAPNWLIILYSNAVQIYCADKCYWVYYKIHPAYEVDQYGVPIKKALRLVNGEYTRHYMENVLTLRGDGVYFRFSEVESTKDIDFITDKIAEVYPWVAVGYGEGEATPMQGLAERARIEKQKYGHVDVS